MKEHFPIFQEHPNLVYLDSAATAHKPKAVIDRMVQFYSKEYATVHRTAYKESVKATDSYNLVREKVRHFLGASHTEEIVFTRGTTDAINLVARSLGKVLLKKEDVILISEMEHHSNIVPWQIVAKETGASLRFIPITDEGNLQWENEITPNVKIISLGHMSNVTGTINPISAISKKAKEVGAIVVVDGAQAAAHLTVDVQALGCDFYAFSGHKCYGPTGIGILYGKKELLEIMPPIQGGGDMIQEVTLLETTYAKPPLRFEAGTPMIAQVIGLGAALDWMEGYGRREIEKKGTALRIRAEERLKKIPGLKILGTSSQKGPIITFTIERIHPLDLASFLTIHDIAIRSGHLCAKPLLARFGLKSAARASFGVYNTEKDVDLFIDKISESIRVLS